MLSENLSLDLFGKLPDRPLHLSITPLSINEEFLSGSAIHKLLDMSLEFEVGAVNIPLNLILPKTNLPSPAIIYINEEREINCTCLELVAKGYAVLSIYYADASGNNGSFKDGIAKYISPKRRKKSSAGKIALWAWAAIRALEYAEDLQDIDINNIGVMGKGIFGYSAILASKESQRFSFCMALDTPTIDEDFLLENPHLFGLSCKKTKI